MAAGQPPWPALRWTAGAAPLVRSLADFFAGPDGEGSSSSLIQLTTAATLAALGELSPLELDTDRLLAAGGKKVKASRLLRWQTQLEPVTDAAPRGVRTPDMVDPAVLEPQPQPQPQPSRAETAEAIVGLSVEAIGLQGAPQHNGKTGTVESWDAGKGRYVIVLDEGGRRMALRSANLRLVHDADMRAVRRKRLGLPPAASDGQCVDQEAALLAAMPYEAAAAHRRATVAAVKDGRQQCAHEFVSQFADQPIGCDCCWKPVVDVGRLAAETAKKEAALAEDGTGEAHADFLWSRAVTVGWLLEFTNRNGCWKWIRIPRLQSRPEHLPLDDQRGSGGALDVLRLDVLWDRGRRRRLVDVGSDADVPRCGAVRQAHDSGRDVRVPGGQGTAFPFCSHCRPSSLETVPFFAARPSS